MGFTQGVILASLILLVSAVQPQTYVYKKVGDVNILLDVFVPETTTYSKYPVVFGTHGGAYVLGSKGGVFSERELNEILKRGWVAVSIDYRLSPGVLLEDIIQDCQDAYDWVRNELVKTVPIDPKKITVYGGSAGGGLAVLNGYRLTPRPKVVISFYPYCTNFLDPYSYDPSTPVSAAMAQIADSIREIITEYDHLIPDDPRAILFQKALEEKKTGWFLSSVDPKEPTDKIIEKLKKLSAVYNVDKNYPATYLIHGLKDSLVPYSQSVQLADKLKEAGVPYKLDLVPGAEHAFDLLPVTELMWKQHILPIFDFAQLHMNGLKTEEISA